MLAVFMLGIVGPAVAAPVVAEQPPPDSACRYHDPKVHNQLLNAAQSAVETWPQQRLRYAEVWPFSRGDGITVAVVDSGVDAGQEQLKGRVQTGYDVTQGKVTRGGTTDCYAHGTLVAGIVAAQPYPGRALVGVAPEVKILPVRETWGLDANAQPLPGSADALLRAMRVAVTSGAEVVNVSVTVADTALTDTQRRDFAQVAQLASDRDVLVVVATGNKSSYDNENPVTYPARLASWYGNFIAVSGISSSGQLDQDAITGSFVTLTAPDQGMPCLMDHGGLVPCIGTSFAAPFVSGVGALVRSRYPAETAQQVRDRLVATADHPASDLPDPGFGYGVVNPLAAVTAVLAEASADPTPVARAGVPTPSAGSGRRDAALVVAAVGVGLALLLPLAAATVRQGRRRGWRPGVRPEPTATVTGSGPEPPAPDSGSRSAPAARRGG